MRLESTSQRMPPVQYVTTGSPLELVVLAGVEQLDEVARRLDVGHDGPAEPADRRLERVAAVEEDDVVAALGDELVQRIGREPSAAADDPVVVDAQFARARRTTRSRRAP